MGSEGVSLSDVKELKISTSDGKIMTVGKLDDPKIAPPSPFE